MFKKIPGNTDYSINLKGEVRNIYGNIVELEKGTSNRINIELFGKKKEMHISTLALLAWYEVGHIVNLERHLSKIVFHPIEKNSLRLRCGYIMSFTDPIYYREGFRYIPSFPRYAISEDSTIIDTFTNEVVTNRMLDLRDPCLTDGYETAYVRNPDRCANRHTRVHRLLALAWIPNDDFVNRPYINHLDGVRSNNGLANLEWCSLSENVRHALDTGLNDTQVAMKTRDSKTGEIRIHKSVVDLGKFLGFNLINAARFDRTLPGYRYGGRYEIKRSNDNSPWFYENDLLHDHSGGKAIYTITVFNKTSGEKKVFSNVNVFYREHGIKPIDGGLDANISAFKESNPELEISYKRNALIGPYRVVDLKNNKTVFLPSIPHAAALTGVGRNMIRYDLSSDRKFIYANRWIIAAVPPSRIFDSSEYVHKPSYTIGLMVVNVVSGEETKVASIREAENLTGFTRRTINKYLTSGKTLKGFKFRPLTQ